MSSAIDIWIWSLSDRRPEAGASVLSADETARAARFVNPMHGAEYRAGRSRMRHILGSYVGCPAEKICFAYNAFGKPSVLDGPRFNLSHSGGIACLAVHPTHDLGVDIEAFRPVEDGVAKRFFSGLEYAALSKLPLELWDHGFFRCWTRKEAIVKACGPGLSMPLDSFDVTLAPDQPAQVLRIDGGAPKDWQLHHLTLHPTMVGAVAVKSRGPLDLRLKDAPDHLSAQLTLG